MSEGHVRPDAQVESPTMSANATPSTPRPLFVTLGRLLEAALNRLVDLDPETRERLRTLDGRAVTLEPGTGLPALRIAVERDQLRVGPGFGGESALRVNATPGSLLAMALRRGETAPAGQVQIAGDADLARRLEQIASRFAPDFDAAFAEVFGDVLGFQIARGLRAALRSTRGAADSLLRDGVEFLTEEGRDLVPRAELETFLDEVDAIRERGDRLAARFERLTRQHGNRRA